jgi:TRAP-type mannitol/chloroaromatic compound transport system substrate-binding protein
VHAALGAVPQQIPGGEIYQALERGTIDAAEWVGPYDDEKLGLQKIARFYYYPGWWEPGPLLEFYVNQKAFDALPADYKAALEGACHEADITMTAEYDAKNPAALARLVNGGAQLRAFSPAIMQAAFKASQDIYNDEANKFPEFKKVFDSYSRFQRDSSRWMRVCEAAMDNFRPAA